MVVRAAQDPFGLGRLSQSIRQNRAEQRQTGIDQQQAVTRGLQQQLFGGQVQQQQQSLADLAAGRQLQKEAFAGTQTNPEGESDIDFKIKLFRSKGRNDLADKLFDDTQKRITSISNQDPAAATTLFNRDLGPSMGITLEHKGKSNFGDVFSATDNETGESQLMVKNEDTGEFVKAEGLEGFSLTPKATAGGGDLQKTGAFLVKDDEGNTSIAVGVFDKTSGDLKTETTVIPNANLVSKLGETGAEQTERKVGQKQQEVRVKEEEERAGELIERGTLAAESTATLRRAIGLLDDIKTGGFENVKLRAKQLLGIESADEGELSNSLGKAVLSQLRETFGAAFTENEGNRLARIEASFGKSTEANKRLLKQALSIAERTAKRARKKAVDRGDNDTVADIDELLSFSLSGEKKPQAKQISELSDEEILEGLNAN